MSDFFKSIAEVASQPTERKDPATAPSATSTEQYYSPEEKKPIQAPAAATDKPAEQLPAKMSKEEAAQSGKASAHLIADGIETVLTVVELFRFVKSMSPEQKQALEEMQTKPVADWTDQDKHTMQIFLKQQAKHDKIKENIGFKPSAVADMADSMSTYHEITGKKMSPEILIATTIGKHLSMKLSDMFL